LWNEGLQVKVSHSHLTATRKGEEKRKDFYIYGSVTYSVWCKWDTFLLGT